MTTLDSILAGTVPDDGEDEQRLFGELQRRVEDAQFERSEHERQWDDNHKLVIGDHGDVFDTGKHHYFVSNRVRQIIDSHVAIMTEQTPRNTYDPRETGEPADWLLRPEATQKLQAFEQLPISPEQAQGQAFIDDPTARQLLSVTVQQEDQVLDDEGNSVSVTNSVPVFTEDDFIVVDARLEADLLSKEVHNESETMAEWESRITENIFGAQVIGHKDMLVEWDDENHHFTVKNLYPYNVWIDPWANDTSDAEYYIIREFLPISQAKSEYPDLSDFIDRHSTTAGASTFVGHDVGGKFQRSGTRKSIERWTWWQRNQPIDLTEQEALDQGLVETAMQAVEQPMTDPETGQALMDFDTGDPMTEMVDQPVTTDEGEQVYRLADQDALVMPGDAQWPKRSGLRQIQFLSNHKVFDAESPFVDVPSGRNKCMMIDESPYGQGEPQRIAELCDLRNRLFSIYWGYAKRFRSPEQTIPSDVYEETKQAVEELHADASKKWIIPSELWMQYGGQVIQNLEPPQLGTVISEMMNVVDLEIDKVSGLTDVLRGETKSDQSGELFRQATEAARGPIGLKSRNTARCVKHIGHIIAYLIIDFLPAEVWAQRNREYPQIVYERVKERLSVNGVNVVPQVTGSEPLSEKVDQYARLMEMGVTTPTMLNQLLDIVGVKDAQKIVSEWSGQQQAIASQEST